MEAARRTRRPCRGNRRATRTSPRATAPRRGSRRRSARRTRPSPRCPICRASRRTSARAGAARLSSGGRALPRRLDRLREGVALVREGAAVRLTAKSSGGPAPRAAHAPRADPGRAPAGRRPPPRGDGGADRATRRRRPPAPRSRTATALDHALLRWSGRNPALSAMQIWSRYHSPSVRDVAQSNVTHPIGRRSTSGPSTPHEATSRGSHAR